LILGVCDTIELYVSNITKSINIVIKCKRLITILDLKELIAKELDTYACLFRLTNGTNLEEDLDLSLNNISSVPSELSQLKNLTYMDLFGFI
jgi:hypothetical protein